MKVSITTNKKAAFADVMFYSAKIHIFVREEPHYSKDPSNGEQLTTRALAKKLSVGFVTSQGLDVPARPFMKQFREQNKDEIINILKMAKAKGFKGWKAKQQYQWAAEQIRDRLMAFLYLGQVEPSNAKYTLEHKSGTAPLVDTTQLLYALDAEVSNVTAK